MHFSVNFFGNGLSVFFDYITSVCKQKLVLLLNHPELCMNVNMAS